MHLNVPTHLCEWFWIEMDANCDVVARLVVTLLHHTNIHVGVGAGMDFIHAPLRAIHIYIDIKFCLFLSTNEKNMDLKDICNDCRCDTPLHALVTWEVQYNKEKG